MKYLYHFDPDKSSEAREILDVEMRGMPVIDKHLSASVHSYIEFEHPTNRSFYISEFHGNCSAIILDGIQALMALSYIPPNCDDFMQHKNYDGFKAPLELAIHIGICLNYKFLFVSFSNRYIIELYKSLGFQIMCEGPNPHSGNHNVFLYLDLQSDVAKNLYNKLQLSLGYKGAENA